MRRIQSARSVALAFASCVSLLVLGAGIAHAGNLLKVQLYKGGSISGPAAGYPASPAIDPRTWPPGCGKKQIPPPATPCAVPYYGRHPYPSIPGMNKYGARGALLVASGMNGANLTFDANGFDNHVVATVLGIPGFPVLINKANEDYGHASFGPGLGVGAVGTASFMATGFDPKTLGTQTFMYDPLGSPGTVSHTFVYPPQTPGQGSIAASPGHGGFIRYAAQGAGNRYGGTLDLLGVNNVFLVLTFNPGVATSYHFPVAQSPGTPIPSLTVSGSPIPGNTFINRKKVAEPQHVRQNLGFTPGGFVSLGSTISSKYTFGMRTEGPFTTGMVNASQHSRPGVFPTTTLRTDTGMKNLTAGGLGTIQLVQPFIIRSMSPNGPNGRTFTAKLKVTVVPEPGAMLMLGCGVAGLVGLEVLKRRRQWA